MKLSDLSGKRVIIWGAGREGSALLSALDRLGINADLKIVAEETIPGQKLGEYPVVPFDAALLMNCDVVVRSPGVSIYRDELVEAKKQGIVVTTATNLWFGEPHVPVIGVTGTKGKSTTSSLISHLLNGLGIRAELAGNIGRSPIDLLGEGQPDWWVLELSSYQASDLTYSPQIGVLTSLSPEHLDWHGSYETYITDKLNLFANDPNMTSVVNVADPGASEKQSLLANVIAVNNGKGLHVRDGVFYLDNVALFSREKLQLQGLHNEHLACLALAVIAHTGIDVIQHADALAASLATFSALPSRLCPIGEYGGVLYVDDSLSTTPVASIAAMNAYGNRCVTILVGGHDRGLSYDNLAEYVSLNRNRVKVVTLPESGVRIAQAIRKAIPDGDSIITESENIEEAVKVARKITPVGGAVLLSPGAPSFGQFRNYAERGLAFKEVVERENNNSRNSSG